MKPNQINPRDPQTDQLGNLYRAALYLGQGQVDLGLNFLKKTLVDNPKEQKRFAEYTLDEYKRQLQNQSNSPAEDIVHFLPMTYYHNKDLAALAPVNDPKITNPDSKIVAVTA